ncbi:MAG: hypothetical protein ONB44_03710 [candidate division KSB1 bacterium]|nr:hypothetical protein [candidate division KSB1 bacterium]MDZ7301235.1 hypothetical protein [candidate division KSB1 bacterium]MDZ7310541.1 hypothetical protein [candidate division KSB1 bacterium]
MNLLLHFLIKPFETAVGKFYKTVSFLLCVSLLQFFVPVLNKTMKSTCCKAQTVAGVSAPCCEFDSSSRMVCCSGGSARPLDEPLPARTNLEKPSRMHADLGVPAKFDETGRKFALTTGETENFSSFNHHLACNQRYKLMATFLI